MIIAKIKKKSKCNRDTKVKYDKKILQIVASYPHFLLFLSVYQEVSVINTIANEWKIETY